MNFAESQRNPGKHPTGLIIVIVMHVLLAWALVSGLARKVVDVVKGENVTKIVEEVKPPPPPPPEKLPPPPPNMPPPPVFTPPPEVQVQTPPTPSPIQSTNVAPPAQDVRIQPVTPAAPPAPPAPPAVAARPARINANDPACKPEYTAAATRAGATGTMRIRVTVDANGHVTKSDIVTSSGPTREHRGLDRAAQEAFTQCQFIPGVDATGKPVGTTTEVDYLWKLD